MLYKANGVKIDASGNLEIPPRYETFDDIPSSVFKKLKPVAPPTVFNVHRWSLEEDLTLLKAVPKMGHMWAGTLGNKFHHSFRPACYVIIDLDVQFWTCVLCYY
jgi:hypothetical protein